MSERVKFAAAMLLGAALTVGGTVLASTPASLPTSCSSGEIVVWGGSSFECQDPDEALGLTSCSSGELVVWDGSELECREPHEALRIEGCQQGDFVTVGSSGRLACFRPSHVSWDVKNLLPDCASGATLVSEGFGRWRCVDPPR